MKSKILICLVVLMLVGGSGWIWYSVISPQQMLVEAEKLAQDRPHESLELIQEALFRSGGDYPEAELMRAKVLGFSGRWEESLGAFSLIEHPAQLPARQLLELGKLAQETGNYYLSELSYGAASQATDEPNQLVALRSLIQVLLFTRQEEKALGFVDRLIEMEPHDPLAWQIRGTIELNQRNLPEAEEAFRKCLEFTSSADQERSVEESLIQVLLDQGKLKEARQQLDLYLKEHTRSAQIRLAEAYLLRLEGLAKEGLETLEPLCVSDHPKQTKALYLRGLLRFDLKQYNLSIEDWSTVIKQEPWHKEAHSKLATAYRTTNQIELAKTHAEISETLTQKSVRLLDLIHQLSKNPGNNELRQEVIRLHRELGKFEEAQRFQ